MYRRRFEGTDFRAAGTSPDGRLVEFIELEGHPFWVGTQAHPEFMSRPTRPAPLFEGFIGAALERAQGRNPQLIELPDSPAVGSATPGDDAADGASPTVAGVDPAHRGAPARRG